MVHFSTAVTRFDTLTDSDDAIIQPDGRVTTMIRARFDTVCACQVGGSLLFLPPLKSIFLEAFPFDIQYCGWNFDGGWAGDDRQRIVPNFAKNKTYLIVRVLVYNILGITVVFPIQFSNFRAPPSGRWNGTQRLLVTQISALKISIN